MRIITMLTIALFPIQLWGQLDLDEVLSQARQNSIFYHEAIRDINVSEANFNFYKTNFKPQLGLNINIPNYFKTSREIVQPNGSIQFQSISQNNSAISLNLSQAIPSTGATLFASSDLQRFDDYTLDQRSYNGIPIRIGIRQPLMQFNNLKWDQKIQPIAREIADRKYILDIEDINIQTVEYYFSLLLSQENLSIASNNKEINERLLNIAEERYTLGKLSENDRLQLSLELQNATRDYTRAQYELQASHADLVTYLKNESQAIIPEIVIPEPMDLISISLEKAIEEAQLNRPEYLEFQQNLLVAEREIDRAKKEYGLQADVFASFGYARGSQELQDIYSDPITEQQLAVSVSIPILDWGKKREATRMAQEQYQFIQKRNEQEKLDFDNMVKQTVYLFDQLQKEVISQKKIREVTDRRYNISRERYILGDISTTDLTISQQEKDRARRNYVATLREYWSTFYRLRQLTGYDFITNKNITYTIN